MKTLLKTNYKELILLLVFLINTIVLRMLGYTTIMTIIDSFLIICITVVCIMNYNNYTIINTSGNKSMPLFIFGTYSKIMQLISTIFLFAGFPGSKTITLFSLMLILTYIIICLVKKAYKEALIGFIYKLI